MDENAAYSRLFVGFVLLLCIFVIQTFNLPLCLLDCRCRFSTLVCGVQAFNTTLIVVGGCYLRRFLKMYYRTFPYFYIVENGVNEGGDAKKTFFLGSLKGKPYLCNVFFIVLDLRLTMGWVAVGIPFFFLFVEKRCDIRSFPPFLGRSCQGITTQIQRKSSFNIIFVRRQLQIFAEHLENCAKSL